MTALIYDLIYIISVTLTAAFYYCGLSNLERISPAVCVAVFIPSLFLSLLHHLRLKGRLMLLGVTAAGLIGILIIYRHFPDSAPLGDNSWILPFLLLSAASYAAGILMSRLPEARLGASLLCLLLLVLTLISIIHPLKPGIFSAMFIILISIADDIQLRWKKDGFTDRKTHVIYTAPFVILIIITASLIHYPEKPYDWKEFIAIKDGVFALADRIGYCFGPGADVITGFSDDGYLRTGLGSSTKTELRLNTRSDAADTIYLTGTISDSFDGHRWTHTDDSSIPERTMDVLESLSSAKSYSDDFRDYYREADISVEYEDLKSKYLFAPSKLISKDSTSGGLSAEEKGGVLTFRRYNPYHMDLNERCLISNTDSPAFSAFMKSNSSPKKKQWDEALQLIKPNEQAGSLSYENFPAYEDHIINVYSENVPLSDELKAKTDMLYAGAESGFEKMKRLEAAFQTMEYTLDPPPIPDTVGSSSEFLDHFLLGGGGGYCSYYATAFALLARAEGLPARYVQGYRVSVDKKGSYTVTSDMAHAWPEVYFKGKGWILFEPTPGFYTQSLWPTKDEAASAVSPLITPQNKFEPAVSGSVSEAETDGTSDGYRVSAWAVFIPLSLIAAFFISFILISRLLRQRKICRLDDEARLLYLAKDSINILKLMGKGIKKSETLSEYMQRVQKDVGPEALSFIPGYEELLYSDRKTGIAPDIFTACRNRLLELLKKKSRLRYLVRILL